MPIEKLNGLKGCIREYIVEDGLHKTIPATFDNILWVIQHKRDKIELSNYLNLQICLAKKRYPTNSVAYARAIENAQRIRGKIQAIVVPALTIFLYAAAFFTNSGTRNSSSS